MGGSSSQLNNVLIFGLNNAGKTKFLYSTFLDFGEMTIDPTVGFNCEEVDTPYGKVNLWDIGGHEFLRNFWHFYSNRVPVRACIFIINTIDFERFPEAQSELLKIMYEPTLQGTILAVIFNSYKPPPNQKECPYSQKMLETIFKMQKLRAVFDVKSFLIDVGKKKECMVAIEWIMNKIERRDKLQKAKEKAAEKERKEQEAKNNAPGDDKKMDEINAMMKNLGGEGKADKTRI